MDELMDMIIADESPSNISDKIKEILFAKAADRVDELRPNVANAMFANQFETEDNETEIDDSEE